MKFFKSDKGSVLITTLVLVPIIGMAVTMFSTESLNFLKLAIKATESEAKIKIVNDIERLLLSPENCKKTFEGINLVNGAVLNNFKLDDGTAIGLTFLATNQVVANSKLILQSIKVENVQIVDLTNSENRSATLNLFFQSEKNAYNSNYISSIPFYFKVNAVTNIVEHCVSARQNSNGQWTKNLAGGLYYGQGPVGVGPVDQYPSRSLGVGDIDVESYYAINGNKVLKPITATAESVLLGVDAGNDLTTLSLNGGSVFLGAYSGPHDGSRTDLTENSEVAIGYQAGQGHHPAIGSVQGNLTIGSRAASSASAGNIVFGARAASSIGSVNHLQEGTYLGFRAGQNSDGNAANYSGIFIGFDAGYGFTVSENVVASNVYPEGNNLFIGAQPGGESLTTVNTINMGSYTGSGYFNGDGGAFLTSDSINIGESAGVTQIQDNSVCVGPGACGNRAFIISTIALGYATAHDAANWSTTRSGIMNNIVIGGESMMEFDDNNGFHNTAIGFNSFLDLTGGQTNLAIGLQAGDNLVSGNYNFMIGTFAESYQANINGQLNIGNLIRGYKVSDIYRIHIGTPFQNKKAQFIAEGTLGTCTINSSTLCASDSRYKANIENLADNLENVTALQPVHFEWKSNSKKDIGFIAQQVEDYLPEVIEKGSKGLEINYNSLMAYTVNALNENYIKLVELEKKCENESFQEIEKENQELENLINQLERLLSEKAKHG